MSEAAAQRVQRVALFEPDSSVAVAEAVERSLDATSLAFRTFSRDPGALLQWINANPSFRREVGLFLEANPRFLTDLIAPTGPLAPARVREAAGVP